MEIEIKKVKGGYILKYQRDNYLGNTGTGNSYSYKGTAYEALAWRPEETEVYSNFSRLTTRLSELFAEGVCVGEGSPAGNVITGPAGGANGEPIHHINCQCFDRISLD